MARIDVSLDELQLLAQRIGSLDDGELAKVRRLLGELRSLEAGWVGGRAPALAEALAHSERSVSELSSSLATIRTFLREVGTAMSDLDSHLAMRLLEGDAAEAVREPIVGVTLAISEDEIRRNWVQRRGARTAVPFGWRMDNGRSIDLTLDGSWSCGLLSGLSGSGKTELLRTLVLSSAVRLPPSEVEFALIDYKGGAFNDLARLPHVKASFAGESRGALRRLLKLVNAEVDVRIDATRHSPDVVLPLLVVVIDEASGLAWDDPEPLDHLAQVISRFGRSIRIRLLIATQSLDRMSETLVRQCDLRLALRVASADASRVLLGSDVASRISPGEPGLGYLNAAPARLRPFQAALSGYPEQILEAVSHAADSARVGGLVPSSIEWPPELPRSITVPELVAKFGPDGCPIGLADYPERLAQRPLVWHPHSGDRVLIVGPPGSGKSTALSSIARWLGTVGSSGAEPFHYLSAASHLLWSGDRLDLPPEDDAGPLLVDGLDEYSSTQTDLLLELFRTGLGRRAVIATTRPTRLATLLQESFQVVITLSPWTATGSGGDAGLVTDRVPGRGVWDKHEIQLVQ